MSMTEEQARQWLQDEFSVSRETWDRLERYVAILLDEMKHQNLIAESTRDHVWARHIVDSAQLLKLVPPAANSQSIWADLGAGAGLPGVVIAILSGYHVSMIEMRRKRIEFLEKVVQELGLNASVFGGKVERAAPAMTGPVSVISARAYAAMDRLIESAFPLVRKGTIWVLPKGQNYQNELDIARTLWHSDASIAPSLTAEDSAILVLKNVRKKGQKA